MFDSNTYLKILVALDWSIVRADEVKSALLTAEADSVIEAEVKALLTDVTTARTLLQTELSSANSGLIQADVLKWESAAARRAGMQINLDNLTKALANLLGLEWSDTAIYTNGTSTIGINVN